jgi:hypothetical protein
VTYFWQELNVKLVSQSSELLVLIGKNQYVLRVQQINRY